MTAIETADPGKKKPSIFSYADDLAKLATLVLGVLYILGLLISNIQLMELGIADFSSLQARNILIGFIFLFVIFWLFIIAVPIAAIPAACGLIIFRLRAGKLAKLSLCVAAIAVLAIGFLTVGYFAGLILGYLYPGGGPWSAGFQQPFWGSWEFVKSDVMTGWSQLSNVFAHPKFTVALIFIVIAEALAIAVVVAP